MKTTCVTQHSDRMKGKQHVITSIDVGGTSDEIRRPFVIETVDQSGWGGHPDLTKGIDENAFCRKSDSFPPKPEQDKGAHFPSHSQLCVGTEGPRKSQICKRLN